MAYNIRRVQPSQRLAELDSVEFPGCNLSSRCVWWQSLDSGGRIIAYTVLEPWSNGVAFLARSWVHPKHRGNGLQRRLIGVRERYAKREGFRKLVSYTSNENCPSANSLIRCGYKTYSPQELWGVSGCTYWFKVLNKDGK